MTPQEIEAQAAELQQLLATHGASPEDALMAEGRERARPRYQRALDRARENGYTELATRIEGMIEADAQAHARRGMRRGGGIGSDAVAAPPAMAPRQAPMPAPTPAPAVLPTGDQMIRGFDTPAPSPAPDRMPTGGQMLGTFMPAPGTPPSTYQRPGYRPTSGIAAGPQSAQEQEDLASEPNVYNFLAEASGLGSAGRSQRAFSEGRPIEGAANAGLAMLPYRPLLGLGALGGAFGGAVASDLSRPASAQQPEPDDGLIPQQRARQAELVKLLRRRNLDDDQREGYQRELDSINKQTADYISGRNAARIETERQRASSSAQLEAQKAQKTAEEEAAKRYSNTPFRERFPQINALLPYLGIGLAAGVPAVNRLLGNVGTWMPGSRSRRMDALSEGMETITDPRMFALRQREMQNLVDARRPTSVTDLPQGWSGWRDELGQAAKIGVPAGLLTAEATMFPHQYDAVMLPPGAEQDAARRRALDLPAYLERGAIGGLTGMSAYESAALMPTRRPNVERARAMLGESGPIATPPTPPPPPPPVVSRLGEGRRVPSSSPEPVPPPMPRSADRAAMLSGAEPPPGARWLPDAAGGGRWWLEGHGFIGGPNRWSPPKKP